LPVMAAISQPGCVLSIRARKRSSRSVSSVSGTFMSLKWGGGDNKNDETSYGHEIQIKNNIIHISGAYLLL